MAVYISQLLFCLFVGVYSSTQKLEPGSDLLSSSDNELLAVVALYNHGNISPIRSFPTDPYYDSSYWPEGFGQLLTAGVLTQYNLGKWLWKRYQTFLPEEYSPKDLLVYSIDEDRALMSAEANLAGFYPPSRTHIWEDNFFWEPIPVHLLATDDPVLGMNVDCPKYNQLLEDLEKDPFIQYIYESHREMMDNLSSFTGMTVSTLADVRMIMEVIYIYRSYNATYVPSWIDGMDQFELYYLNRMAHAQATYTTELRRLRSGPFFNFLIRRFEEVISNNTDVEKFLMLSGNATTVSSVLGGMEIFNEIPEFAATVIWELRRNADNKYFINTLYKSDSSDSYIRYGLTNCGVDCAFSSFKTLFKRITLTSDQWRNECNMSSGPIVFSWSLLIMAVVLHLAT